MATKKSDNTIKKIDRLETATAKLVLEVTKQGEALNKLVTKKEFNEFKGGTFKKLDGVMTILNRLDQERYFTFERVNRLENEVEKHSKEIKEIKEVLDIH